MRQGHKLSVLNSRTSVQTTQPH